uniref:PET domain-containing protein n=1 Tax=Romanomermis culicivorax TaxID=13658 RepID=A0A915IK24_ROMCU
MFAVAMYTWKDSVVVVITVGKLKGNYYLCACRKSIATPFHPHENRPTPQAAVESHHETYKKPIPAPPPPPTCVKNSSVAARPSCPSVIEKSRFVTVERPFTGQSPLLTHQHPELFDVDSCRTVKNIVKNFEASGFLKPNVGRGDENIPKTAAKISINTRPKFDAIKTFVTEEDFDERRSGAKGLHQERKKSVNSAITKNLEGMVQEVNEGQPCYHCSLSCPGYKPHPWRNICCRCKCARDFHDVEEYMAQLPSQKVPKSKTAGEKYRNRQLMLQLPRQDLAPAYCKHLYNNIEMRAFEDFVNSRNEISLDIGHVTPSLDRKGSADIGIGDLLVRLLLGSVILGNVNMKQMS